MRIRFSLLLLPSLLLALHAHAQTPLEGEHTAAPPTKAVPAAVADVEWTLVRIERDAQAREPLAGSKATLRMRQDGAVGGLATINRYFGAARLGGDGIVTWTGPMGSTQMAGPPDSMQQEAAFLEALQAAARWRIEGPDCLVLGSADDAVRLVFRR